MEIPSILYLMISGRGNPGNSEEFQNGVSALYSLSYKIKMSPKKNRAPAGYFPYVVPPLEGLWDLPPGTDPEAALDKDKLIWTIMIRQPDFVKQDFVEMLKEELFQKESNPALPKVRLEQSADGLCCQMMHLGSFDDEPVSFAIMEEWINEQGYERLKKSHREIYLNDFRKVTSEKLKTVLRFQVERLTGK